MKKVIFSLVATAALTSVAFAGKNVAPAPIPPAPVPQKPAPKAPEVVPPLGLYVGGGLTYAHTKCSCDQNVKFSNGKRGKVNSSDTYGFNVKAGYEFNQYLAFEGLYLYTPWGDKDKTLKHYGVYLKPKFAVNNIDAYALLGYGKTKCETLNKTFKGFSWGVGTEYSFGETSKNGTKSGWGIYAEYLHPLDKSGSTNVSTHVVSGGLTYHF